MSGKGEAYRFLSCQLACRPLRKLHLPASKCLDYKDYCLAVAFHLVCAGQSPEKCRASVSTLRRLSDA